MKKFRLVGMMLVLVLIVCVALTACNKTTLTGITLNTDNVKKDFTVGDTFNYNGLIVTANYSDDTQEVVADFTVSTPDMSTEGTKTVTVTYMEKTATYSIAVSEPYVEPQRTLQSISIDTDKVQKEFTVGDTFNYDNLVVTAHYNLEPLTETVTTGYTVSTPDMTQKGSKIVTVSYQGKTARYTITVNEPAVVEPELVKITVDATGATTVYTLGSEFSYAGIVVTAHYDNDTTEVITEGYDVNTDELDMNVAGVYTVTVTYQTKEATYDVTVKDAVLVKIEVDYSKATTTFFVGDEFSYQGIVVTAYYDDDSSYEVTGYTVSDPDMNTAAEEVTVTVTYQGKDATYNISVKQPALTGISVEEGTAKLIFFVGDEFSYEGIVVKAHYENGSTKTLNAGDYDVSTPDMTEVNASITVTVTYEQKTAEYHITVKEPALTGITVEVGEAQVEFYAGDEFSYDGIVVKAHYENNKIKTLEKGEYTVSEPNMDQIADTVTITITYQGETATYTITLAEPTLSSISVDESGAQVKFYIDGTFSYDGIVVTAHYENGWSRTLATGDYQVVSPDMTTIGDKQVVVKYKGMEDEYTVTVEYKVFAEVYNDESLKLQAEDSWLQGGLKVEGTFVGGISSGDKLTFMFNSNVDGAVELYLSMGRMETIPNAFYVYVNDPNCETQYSVGIENTGGWTTMKEFFICRVELVSGLNTVVIVANSAGINVDYLLIEPSPDLELDGIEVEVAEAKTAFSVGETFTYEGIVVKAKFSNGSTEPIERGYEVSTPDMTTEGTKTVTVSYQGYEATYQITVSYKVFANEYNGESIKYEAEEATLEGGPKASGTYVGNIKVGNKIIFKFNSTVAEKAELYLSMGHAKDYPNAFHVYVNDPDCATLYSVNLTNTGGWTTMKEFFVCRVELVVGVNTVVIVSNSVDINLDYLRVAPDSSSDDLVLDHIEVDTNNAKTQFNIREDFSTEGLVVKAWYSNNTYDIVTDYQVVDQPDMTTTGNKTITVSYKDKTASYEITVKDPSAPDPEWAMTKISLRVDESKVYLVFSGTFVSYNEADLQSTLYAALQWDITNTDTWVKAPSVPDRIFVYGEKTWEIKMEITIGSFNNYFQIGRHFIDKTNPDNDKVGLYLGKWTIGEYVELDSYKYEFCEDTYWGTVTFRISKIVIEGPSIYDGSDFEVGASKAELQGGCNLQPNGAGADGNIIGNIGAGCSLTFTVTSNGAASVNLKVFLSSGSGFGAGWENGQPGAFEIYVNNQSFGSFDGQGGGYVDWYEYLVTNVSLNEGENTIEIRFLQGNANFSHMVISPAE